MCKCAESIPPAVLAAAEEIIALAREATPGPFIADTDAFEPGEGAVISACFSNAPVTALFVAETDARLGEERAWDRAGESQAMKDAQFFAACRTLAPLLAEEWMKRRGG